MSTNKLLNTCMRNETNSFVVFSRGICTAVTWLSVSLWHDALLPLWWYFEKFMTFCQHRTCLKRQVQYMGDIVIYSIGKVKEKSRIYPYTFSKKTLFFSDPFTKSSSTADIYIV